MEAYVGEASALHSLDNFDFARSLPHKRCAATFSAPQRLISSISERLGRRQEEFALILHKFALALNAAGRYATVKFQVGVFLFGR